MTRRLAAILAADVAGYSRLIEQDEAGTLAALRERRKNVLDPTVARHHGRVVKVMGDGVLVEFGSAVNAVACAVELQKQFAAANEGLTEDRRIVLRVGVNLGDAVVEGGDLYGDAVIIAVRLQHMAEPGGICISGSVHEQVAGKLDAAFDDLGLCEVKNNSKPVRVYRLRSSGDTAPARPALALPDKPSIAVLPFQNMSGDPEQEYFADGITEDIITELSRFHSLFVIARNSSFQYRDKGVDVRRVARELGVRYVVEGSVRTMANCIRVTAQLIDATLGTHLWSERYDRNIDDLFEVQDEVTRTIVATLTGRVEDAEIRGAASKRTDNLQAYDMLLHGIEHLRGYAPDDNRRARELFECVVSLDPRFALAHAYLGLSLLVENGYGSAPEAIKNRALECTLTAVRLDPGESRCHQFLAQAYRFQDKFDMAIQHFERGAALNPNDANGIAQMGSVLAIAGRAEEGIELIRQAMRLNPLHPEWYWAGLSSALYLARRYEEALVANRQLAPSRHAWPLARVAACLAQLGRLDDAGAQAAEVLRLQPDFRVSAELPHYKNRDDAEHVRDGMLKAGLPE